MNILKRCIVAGYVAIDKTQPEGQWDIAVVFRGTEATTEWYSDIQAEMVQWSDLQKIPRHAGWRGWLPRLKHAMFGEAGVIMVAKVRCLPAGRTLCLSPAVSSQRRHDAF